MFQRVKELQEDLLRLAIVYREDRKQTEVAAWLKYHSGMLGSFAADVKANPQHVQVQLDLALWLTNVGTFLLDHDVDASIPYFMHGVAVVEDMNTGGSEDPHIAHGLFSSQSALARALEQRGQSGDLERAQGLKEHNERLSRQYEREFAMIEGVFDFSKEA